MPPLYPAQFISSHQNVNTLTCILGILIGRSRAPGDIAPLCKLLGPFANVIVFVENWHVPSFSFDSCNKVLVKLAGLGASGTDLSPLPHFQLWIFIHVTRTYFLGIYFLCSPVICGWKCWNMRFRNICLLVFTWCVAMCAEKKFTPQKFVHIANCRLTLPYTEYFVDWFCSEFLCVTAL